MNQSTETLWQEFLAAKAGANNSKDLEDLKIRFLGKKGAVTQLLKELGALSPAEKPTAGAKINQLKEKFRPTSMPNFNRKRHGNKKPV